MDEKTAIRAILEFWFADIGAGFDIASQHALWFGGDKMVDQEITQRFGPWVERAAAGELRHWQDQPESALALVLLLDQFTRNIYRGTSAAFASDAMARAVVAQALANGFEQALSYIQRTFLYMPLMHSEQLADQQQCVALFTALLAEVPAAGKAVISANVKFADQHLQLIQQFGRFPHRNEVLQRTATKKEQEYLAGGGARFGQ